MALEKFSLNISVCITPWAPLRSLERPSDLKSTHVTCQKFLKILISFHFCLSCLLLTKSDLEQYRKGILGSVAFGDRNDAELTINNQTYEKFKYHYHSICLTRVYLNPGNRPAIKMDHITMKNGSYYYDLKYLTLLHSFLLSEKKRLYDIV